MVQLSEYCFKLVENLREDKQQNKVRKKSTGRTKLSQKKEKIEMRERSPESGEDETNEQVVDLKHQKEGGSRDRTVKRAL